VQRWQAILVGVALLASAGTTRADELVSVKVGYQNLSPSGTVAGRRNNIGTKIDIEKDMDLGESNGVTAEAALQLGRSRLSLGYLPIEYSGTGQMTVDGTFNGQPFSASDVVQSAIDLDLYDLGYAFYLLNFDDLPIRLQVGPEVAIKIVNAAVDFVDVTSAINEHESATVGIPTVGGRARAALADYLGAVARVGYLEYDGNQFLDAEAQIEFSPLPLVGVYAGYRLFNLKIDRSDLLVDIDFSGPFAGAFARY
ncbi:MAG: hypothetical protein D6760_00015, partial [Deltaproteobacteria bacterium]